MKTSPPNTRGFRRFALSYATRSLWRNRRRTVLTILTVSLSAAFSIIGSRYAAAVMHLWQESVSDTGTAHAQVHAKGYFNQPEGINEALTLDSQSAMEETLAADPAVEALGQRLALEGIISVGDRSIYFIGLGINPDQEMILSPKLFNPTNDQGTFVSADSPQGVTVGKGMAETLKLKIGDEATLLTHTASGSVNAVDVLVEGIVDVPLPSFSKRIIYMNIDHAQKLVRLPGRFTELAIRYRGDDLRGWVTSNRPLIEQAGAELRGWWDIVPYIKDVEEIWDASVGLISFLLFLSAAISVLNIIFMLVGERTVEIGTLMAIGAKPHNIRDLFALEAGLIGLLGGTFGAIAGNLAVVIMGAVGVPFNNPFGSGQVLIHPSMNLGVTLLIFTAALVICYGSAILPARKAAQVEPVRAFRGQLT